MPTNIKTLPKKPHAAIAASVLRSSNNIVLMPSQLPQAIATSQDYNSLSTNALAISNRGLTRPILLSAQATSLPDTLDPSNTDSGVILPIPFCPTIQTAGGSTASGVFRWRGIDHLGRPVYFTEAKSNVSGAGTFYFQSQCAFSYIETLEVLRWDGPGTDTFLVGAQWDFIQTGSAGPVKRIPLPFPIISASDFVGISFIEIGGAVWSATPWAIGDQLLRWSTGSGVDLSSYPSSQQFNTGLVAMGRATTTPTSNWRISVMQASPARLPSMRDLVDPIVV